MITRKSFFIRWLLVRDREREREEQSVIDIEHIQSGTSCRLSSLEEATDWMRDIEDDETKPETTPADELKRT
ncbi:MAG: hypothetical protein R2684_17330 [Pyrinomonadaceae bacterium]